MPARPPRLLDAGELHVYAVKLLAGRAHSTGEIRVKLERRAARPEDVPQVLAKLKDHGYLNDERFAGGFAAARLENQGFGAGRVLRDLRARRVAPAAAERAVRGVYADVDEDALAEDFLRRKYRARGEVIENEKDLAAAWRRMLRAGFPPDVSMRVLKRYARNPELLDNLDPPEPSVEE